MLSNTGSNDVPSPSSEGIKPSASEAVKSSLLRRLSRVGLTKIGNSDSKAADSPSTAQPALPPLNTGSARGTQQGNLFPLRQPQLTSSPDTYQSNLERQSFAEYNALLEPTKDVWVDCDPGHDDALALLMATHHPGLRLVGVSTVSGNAPGRATYINAARILVAIGADRALRARASHASGSGIPPTPPSDDPDVMYPVLIRGADAPLLQTPRHDASIHGQDGLGGVLGLPPLDDRTLAKRLWASYAGFDPDLVEDPRPDGTASEPVAPGLGVPRASPDRVVAALAAELTRRRRTQATPLHICVTGPCTNTALLIKLHPGLVAPDTVASITIMGGAAGMAGNRWALGEFNAACDPEAIAIVMYHPVKVVMAGLNVTHQAIFTPEVHDRLLQRVPTSATSPTNTTFANSTAATPVKPSAPSNVRKLVSSAVTFFASAYAHDFGFKYGPPVHDILTIVYIADPKLFYTHGFPTTHMGPHAAGIHAAYGKALAASTAREQGLSVDSQAQAQVTQGKPISYADGLRIVPPMRYPVQVETGQGLAVGATVVDFYHTWGRPHDGWGKGGKNVEVLEEVDTEGLWELLLDVVNRAEQATSA